eukprot:15361099-Ditylum_brightwellii.AAC.1
MQKHVGMEREHVHEDSSLQPELKDIELDFFNKDDEIIMDDTEGEAGDKGDTETRDISDSGEMAQQEEDEKEECPELINRGGNDEDSDEESNNEEEMEVDKDEKNSDEALPIKEKGESSTEEMYNEMEEKEEGEYMYETIVDCRFENGILKLKVKYNNEINRKNNIVEVPFVIIKKG